MNVTWQKEIITLYDFLRPLYTVSNLHMTSLKSNFWIICTKNADSESAVDEGFSILPSLVAQMVESAYNVGDPGLIPGSGRCPGEENGNPPQHSCLENSMDRGAWQATVHGGSNSQMWLSDFHSLPLCSCKRFIPEYLQDPWYQEF